MPVIRGKFGATQTISVWDLVVGDVVLLQTGSKIPADCIVLDSVDLKVDEDQDGNIDDDSQMVSKGAFE